MLFARRLAAAALATLTLGATGAGLATAADAAAPHYRITHPRNHAIAVYTPQFVGKRYVEGGASPRTGFDCSGLVQYVYAHSVHIALTHNAERQYLHAHRIPRSRALRGDLVFFHDGSGYVYHVGIYAGYGMMWAAATPRDGVRYQSIWSPAVTFGSFTHR